MRNATAAHPPSLRGASARRSASLPWSFVETGRVATSAATRGSVDRCNSSPGAQAMMRPSCSTATRSASAQASAMSCVTRITARCSAACTRANSSCSSDFVIGVERAERLVHQEQRRIRGERAGQADALPLAAGQFIGPAAAIVGGLESDQRQQLVDASRETRRRPAEQSRHERQCCRRR